MSETITVNRLHKMLGAMIEQGHGRLPVCVDKPTITHPLEGDGACIIEISGCEYQVVPQMDGDGFMQTNSRGGECYRKCVVIYGASHTPTPTTPEEASDERD